MSPGRTAAFLRTDLRLQWRQGIWLAYGFVCLMYVLLLRLLEPPARSLLLTPVLFSEASIIGFFFAGTLIHLERVGGTLQALAVTPLAPHEYVLTRMLSLAGLTAVALPLIAIGSGVPIASPLLLALGGGLTAAFFVPLGTAFAIRFASLERFAVIGGLGSALLGLPLLPFFGILPSPFWLLTPTWPSLALIGRALGDPLLAERLPRVPVALGLLGVWTMLAFLLARAWLERYGHGRRRATP